jgi:poly-gamma-glutamate synthesis protein (capsule biosynthesis protein)
LFLDFCHTRLARPDEAAWISSRFISACAEMGTEVEIVGDRLVIEWPDPGAGGGLPGSTLERA